MRKLRFLVIPSYITLLGLQACATASLSTNTSPCTALEIECSQSGKILITGQADDHQTLFNVSSAAATRFEETFDRPISKTAIVPGGTVSKEMQSAFKAAGYKSVLPWMSEADKTKLKTASIIKQVKAQTEGLPEEIQKMALEKALAALGKRSSSDDVSNVTAGALAHELGHMWFIAAFQPLDGGKTTGHAYGGWAPDWLDETAAVLLENETLRERRRELFQSLSADELTPLRQFLTMEHPSAKAAQKLRARLDAKMGQSSGGSRAIVLSGKDAEEFLKKSGGDSAVNFYAQVQAFADFMQSKTNSEAFYTPLTEHFLAGGNMESWLASSGERWGLPTSLNELDEAWMLWVSQQS